MKRCLTLSKSNTTSGGGFPVGRGPGLEPADVGPPRAQISNHRPCRRKQSERGGWTANSYAEEREWVDVRESCSVRREEGG